MLTCFSLQRCSGEVGLLSLATAKHKPPTRKTCVVQHAGQKQADLQNVESTSDHILEAIVEIVLILLHRF